MKAVYIYIYHSNIFDYNSHATYSFNNNIEPLYITFLQTLFTLFTSLNLHTRQSYTSLHSVSSCRSDLFVSDLRSSFVVRTCSNQSSSSKSSKPNTSSSSKHQPGQSTLTPSMTLLLQWREQGFIG